MKNIYLLALSIFFLSCTSKQAKPKVDFGEFKTELSGVKEGSGNLIEKDVWLHIADTSRSGYVYQFNQNPVGAMNAVNKMKELLKNHGAKYDLPNYDGSFISTLVNSPEDYEALSLTIHQGSSVIERMWIIGEWKLSLQLNEKVYAIMLFK